MKKQVLSIEQMQRLHELGLDTSKASMALIYTNKYEDIIDWDIVDKNIHEEDVGRYNPYLRKKYGAFTLQDILDMLPKDILKGNGTLNYASLYIDYESNRIAYGNTDRDGFEIYYEVPIYENIIDAGYKLLCWAIEQGYIETNKNE